MVEVLIHIWTSMFDYEFFYYVPAAFLVLGLLLLCFSLVRRSSK